MNILISGVMSVKGGETMLDNDYKLLSLTKIEE